MHSHVLGIALVACDIGQANQRQCYTRPIAKGLMECQALIKEHAGAHIIALLAGEQTQLAERLPEGM